MNREMLSKARMNRINMLSLFIAAFGLHAIFNPVLPYISSIPTELLSLSMAGHLAGYNWSAIVSSSDYYGTGFYILFTPLFFIFRNVHLLRQAILVLVCVIGAIPSCIAYQILTRYFKIENKVFCWIVSLTLSFYTVVRTNVAINEHAQILIIWLIIYLTIKWSFTKIKRTRTMISILIAVLMGYSYTIHTRMLTIVIAYLVSIIIIKLIYKKKVINFIPFIASLLISLIIADRYISYVTDLLWKVGNAAELDNSISTLGNIGKNFEILFSKNGIIGYCNIIFGQIYAAVIYSGGTNAIVVIATCYYGVYLLKDTRNHERDHVANTNDLFIILICLFSIAMTILAHGFLSLDGAAESIPKWYGAKSYYYLRYFYIYITPLYVLAMVYIYKHPRVLIRIYWAVWGLFLPVAAFNIISIMPTTVRGDASRLDRSHYFSPFCLRSPAENLTYRDYGIVMLVTIAMLILFYFIIKIKKPVILAMLILILTSYSYIYSIYGTSKYDMEMYYKDYNSFMVYYNDHQLGGKIKKVGIDLDSSYSSYSLQYELMDITIVQGDLHIADAPILLTNSTEKKYNDLLDTYQRTQLDENEYIWIRKDFLTEIEK